MITLLNSPRRTGLFANMAALVIVTLAVNGLIFGLGWAGTPQTENRLPMIPPGYVVGLIWTMLLALMGAARWLFVRRTGDIGWRSWSPFALAALCIAYPFYTGGLAMGPAAFWGTIVTLVGTLSAMFALHAKDAVAPRLLVPTAFWGGYVACVMIAYPR